MSSGGENGSCSLVWAFVFCLPETQYQLKIYTPKALVWSNGLCHCLRLCTDILVLIQNSDQKTRKEDHVDFFFFLEDPRTFSEGIFKKEPGLGIRRPSCGLCLFLAGWYVGESQVP